MSSAFSQCDVPDLVETLGEALNEEGHSVCYDPGFEVYYIGEIRQISPSNGWDWAVQKRDANFNLIWEFSYGTSLDETGDNFLVHPDGTGGCLLAGFENSTFRRMIIARLDETGEIQWAKRLNTNTTNGETPACFALGSNNDVMLVGTTNTFGVGNSDAFILNMNLTDGSVNWSKSVGLSGNQHLYSVKALPDGNFVAVGSASYPGSGGRDPWLLKFNSSGNILNEYILPASGSSNSWIMDIEIDPEGFIYGTGYFSTSGQGGTRLYVSKLNFQLEVIWSSFGPASTAWFGSSVALSSNQELYVLAASQEKSRLVKVNALTGDFEWVKEFVSAEFQYSSIYGQNLVFLADERLFWTGWIDSGTNSNQIARYYANTCDQEECFSMLEVSYASGPSNRIVIQSTENSFGNFQNYSLSRSMLATSEIIPACEVSCSLQGELAVPSHCAGESVTGILIFDNSQGNTTFNWSLNGEPVSTSPDFTLDGSLLSGNYLLELELTQSEFCSLFLSAAFEVLGPPLPLGLEDINVCADSLMLSEVEEANWYFEGAPIEVAFESGSYIYAISNSCGTTEDTVEVSFLSGVIGIVASNPLDCFSPDAVLSVDPPLDQSDYVEWLNLNSGEFLSNELQLSVNAAGHYGVTVLLPNGCLASADVVMGFSQNNPPINLNLPDTLNCTTLSVQLGLEEIPSTFSAIVWYLNGDQIDEATDDPFINVDSPGIYEVEVIYPGGCVSTTLAEVFSLEENIEVIIPADTLDCINQVVQLAPVSNYPGYLFQWTFESVVISNSQNVSAGIPGLYTLLVTNPLNGCSGIGAVVVPENVLLPEFQILISADSLSCSNPVSTVTTISMDDYSHEYAWYNADNEWIGTGPMQSLQEAGTYQVVATNPDNGCVSQEVFELLQSEEIIILNKDIQFPNIITVNDDSRNEQWRPFYKSLPELSLLRRMDIYEVKIYNRWGTLLFDGGISDELPESWSPREFGDGVYYYIASYSTDCDPDLAIREGYIHLLR